MRIFARLSSWASLILYSRFTDFLRLVDLSKVTGSRIQFESILIGLIATYETPTVFSDLPMSIQAFDKVNPRLLCIVMAQAIFKGSCCLSYRRSNVLQVAVIGHIGTHPGILLVRDGPV